MNIKSTLKKFKLIWVFFFLVIFSFSHGWASFDVHVVDDPGHYFGELNPEHAIAIGTNGAIYIAYGGDNLYLATNKENWEIKTVDASGVVGKYPSIALDKYNYPHISYYDGSFGTLNMPAGMGFPGILKPLILSELFAPILLLPSTATTVPISVTMIPTMTA